jgi:hypothetical protein
LVSRKTAVIILTGTVAGGVAVALIYYYYTLGGGTTPPSGGISLTVSPSSVAQGAQLTWSATGLTPNGQCQALICFGTNFTSCLDLLPHPTADAGGRLMSYQVTIGTNVPVGSCIFVIKDLTTGKSAQQAFTVTG